MKRSIILLVSCLCAALSLHAEADLLFAGSSVCNGAGADSYRGYAYLYAEQSRIPYSNLSVNGVNTTYWLEHIGEIATRTQPYVVIGLGLGNEGIHNANDNDNNNAHNPQQVYEQWKTNILAIADSLHKVGKQAIITNNYPRGDYNETDYGFVKQMNLEMQQWDIPTVNLLGALDNCQGNGHWADGYQNGDKDIWHPDTKGHEEFMHAFVPSLIKALQHGKQQPVRQASTGLCVRATERLKFIPEATVHPFTIALSVRTSQPGAVVTLTCKDTIVTLSLPAHKADNTWHSIVFTHYYAAGKSYLYIDGQPSTLDPKQEAGSQRLLLQSVTIGSSGCKVYAKDLFFWRSGMNEDEIGAWNEGKMLRSSLEIYCPLNGIKDNKAQSMNTITLLQ